MGNQQAGFFTIYHSAVDGPEYDYNPNYNQSRLFSDYSAFYAGIGICSAIAVLLIVINIALGCCSPWNKYWKSRFTGNRFALPVYVLPPKDQEPLQI